MCKRGGSGSSWSHFVSDWAPDAGTELSIFCLISVPGKSPLKSVIFIPVLEIRKPQFKKLGNLQGQ